MMRQFRSRLIVFLTAAVALLCAALVANRLAHAQSTKAAATANVGTSFPDNTTGAITPAITRSALDSLINSYQQYAAVNAQTGTGYAVSVSDYGQLITFNNGGAVSVSLNQAIAPSFFPFNVYMLNVGAGLVTVTPSGSTINGVATLTLSQNQSVWIVSDGINYQVFKGFGGTLTGTSGGIVYFNGSGAPVSTVTLSANGVLYGGGAATSPGVVVAGTNGQALLGVTGGPPQMATLSQDCTITNAGVLTCTKTNNVAFTAFATQAVPCLVSQGCTGQITAALARTISGLNIDEYTKPGDTDYVVLATDRLVSHSALSALRTNTLPAANSVNPGQVLVFADFAGVATASNNVAAARAGADMINGATSVTAINAAYGAAIFWSDGVSKWTFFPVGAGGGSGTVTSITGGQSCVSGSTGQNAITSTGVIYCAPGYANKLRNSSLTSWFHGSGTLTITTAGGWCAEGLYISPTGASVTCAQHANGLSGPLTFNSQLITGASGNTNTAVRFVVESYDAAPLAGKQVTCQFPVLNNTGNTITPTLTVKRAGSQDASYTNLDVSSVNLQTVTNGSTATLAYSWAADAASYNGLSIDVSFGNTLSASSASVQIGGGFDCRVTPSVATGTVALPPTPEIPPFQVDTIWNQRFFEASYSNGTAPGANTHTDIICVCSFGNGSQGASGGLNFKTPKRATPVIAYWDGAGNGTRMSQRASSAWTDNLFLAGSITIIGLNSMVIDTGSAATVTPFLHYTADASLTGG